MQRRNFLKNTSVVGLSVAATSLLACNNTVAAKEKATDKSVVDDFSLLENTIEELQKKMAANQLTSAAITQLYLERINAIDKVGYKLHSVIEINPDALSIATAMDKERKQGKLRGPMHGIPVLIKDNIDTADKMQTTAGATALIGNIAAKDAFIVKQLRASGAVLLGKTNLSEWANFRSTNSSSGWSSRGGQTLCPYILTHNPCGSSSGSGVAVAANLCAVAIGTETDGSITCPASINGLVGIKPTVGLLSRTGIIPISATQDTAGPLARTVTDAAIFLTALAGFDEQDEATNEIKNKPQINYANALDINALKGKRIGIDRKRKSKFEDLNNLLETSIEVLKKLGAEIIEVDYVEKINALGKYELEILQTEFKFGVNKYLANANAKVKSLADVIAYNKANEATAMPYFKQEQLENSEKKTGLQNKAYLEALTRGRDTSRQIINALIADNKLDAIAGITMGPACSIDAVYGDRWGDDFLTQPAAMAGFPHISLPAGLVNRLPVGLSIFGTAYTEASLINMAYAFEQATKKRVPPKFIPTFFD